MLRPIVIAAAVMIATTGCGRREKAQPDNPLANKLVAKAIEQSLEKNGGDATVQIQDGKVDIRSEQGNVQIATGDNVAVPADFPKELPLFADATVIQVMTTPEGAYAMLRTPADTAQVSAFYKERLAADGWTQATSMLAEGNEIYSFTREKRQIAVVLSRPQAETLISLTLSTP